MGRRFAGACIADAVADVVSLTAAAAGVVTVVALTALTAFVARLVGSCTTDAEWSVPVATLRAGFGLAAVLDDGRAERADDALLAAEEWLLAPGPESSGVAAATAALAPEAISKPAPSANPNVAIRPARLMEVTSAPAHSTSSEIFRCRRQRRVCALVDGETQSGRQAPTHPVTSTRRRHAAMLSRTGEAPACAAAGANSAITAV